MPRYIKIHERAKRTAPIATQAELLEFANKVRVAGGADVLEALLPSEPGDSDSCLIANACNFRSQVVPIGAYDENHVQPWIMVFPKSMPIWKRKKIAEAAGCEFGDVVDTLYSTGDVRRNVMRLPAHIGNTAAAFDEERAFTKFIIPDEEEDY